MYNDVLGKIIYAGGGPETGMQLGVALLYARDPGIRSTRATRARSIIPEPEHARYMVAASG